MRARERLYLPLSWLREAGIDAEGFLAEPQANDALKRVVARLLEEADTLYRRARPGIGALPAACRPAILAAAEIYAEIGREVERGGHDSVSQRARVTARRKLQLLVKAMAAAPWLQKEAARPPLPAAAFLVNEVARSRLRPAPPPRPALTRCANRSCVCCRFLNGSSATSSSGTELNPNYYGLIEMTLSFGVVLALAAWELYSLAKARRRRLEKLANEAKEKVR